MLFYESGHSAGFDVFQNFNTTNLDFAAHFHRAFEMIDVVSGAIDVTIGSSSHHLQAGDTLIVLPDEIHAYHTPEASQCRMFIFSEDYAQNAYAVLKDQSLVSPVFHMDDRIHAYVVETLTSPDTTRLHRKACIGLACAEVLSQSALAERDHAEDALLCKMIAFVQNNFTQDISLRDLARQFGYDYSYLSRYLNKFLHMSFADFLNGCRVSRAATLLADESLRITEVARLCGYENVRTFNRNFLRVHHCTPREFRTKR